MITVTEWKGLGGGRLRVSFVSSFSNPLLPPVGSAKSANDSCNRTTSIHLHVYTGHDTSGMEMLDLEMVGEVGSADGGRRGCFISLTFNRLAPFGRYQATQMDGQTAGWRDAQIDIQADRQQDCNIT